jgi:hypothetical protein
LLRRIARNSGVCVRVNIHVTCRVTEVLSVEYL